MTTASTPYAAQTVVFATMHGKERLAERAFAERLGATVIAPEHLDTDQLGTFAGDIPRILSPRAAAAVKARLGMQITGLPYGLASEGSFRSSLMGVEASEILLFVDADRGLEILEHSAASSTLPALRQVDTISDALAYASLLGFPDQGVLVTVGWGSDGTIHKGISADADLAEVVARALGTGMTVSMLPDHRAHRSPVRAGRIMALCDRMARRLATPCPACAAPGYGFVEVERGLRCALCGNPTASVAADIHGCAACDLRERRPTRSARADPAGCDHCNP